jgi:hypothetical protein
MGRCVLYLGVWEGQGREGGFEKGKGKREASGSETCSHLAGVDGLPRWGFFRFLSSFLLFFFFASAQMGLKHVDGLQPPGVPVW